MPEHVLLLLFIIPHALDAQAQDDAAALAQQALRTFRRFSLDGPGSPTRRSMSSLRRVSFSGEPSLRRVSFSERPTSPIPVPPQLGRSSGRTTYETSPLRSGSHDTELGSAPRDPAVNSLIRRSRHALPAWAAGGAAPGLGGWVLGGSTSSRAQEAWQSAPGALQGCVLHAGRVSRTAKGHVIRQCRARVAWWEAGAGAAGW